MKKYIASSIIFIQLISPIAVLAGSPTTDAGNAGTHAGNLTTNTLTTSQQILKTIKDYGLDTVAYTLAQKAGQKMATLAVNKATGGASSDKDPNFVKDFGSVLSNIEQQQLDLFTTNLLTSNNPFAREIAKQMLTGPIGDTLPKFTLGNFLENGASWEAVGNDLSLASDKGLLFYSQLAMPQNTPFGANLIAQNELSQKIANQKQTEILKLTSSGFRPQAKCNVSIADYKNNVQNIINSGGGINASSQLIDSLKAKLAAARNSQNQAIKTYGDNSEQANAADAAYYAAEAELNAAIAAQQSNISTGATTLGDSSKDLTMDTAGCIEETINNPLSAVSTITTEAGKFGMDMTKNIDGWGQIVAGLFVSLFNGFINTGLSSLKADYGQAKQTNTGGPEQLAQKNSDGTINFASVPYNIVDLRGDFETALVSTEKNLAVITDMQEELMKVPGKLAVLDMCLPGPDLIGLNNRVQKYYDQQTAWIQKKSIMGSDEKRNDYQASILAMLERDYDLSRAEMIQDINDDTRNIPGASAIRSAINRFSTRKSAYQSAADARITTTDTMARLREVNVELKNTIDSGDNSLMKLSPDNFGSLPGTVFTTAEWKTIDQATRDAIYTWMKDRSGEPQTDIVGLTPDENRMNYVIKKTWDLWEYPERFILDNAPTLWTSEQNAKFLGRKNAVRAKFNAAKDTIPSEWEVSKNEESAASYKSDNAKIDQLIRDCNKMRELFIGDPGNSIKFIPPVPVKEPYNGNDYKAMLADLALNKNTYFESDEIKNSITLPSILTRLAEGRTWEDDNCRPSPPISSYPAPASSGDRAGDHTGGYACYGQFGHLHDPANNEGGGTPPEYMRDWIDEHSNIYQSQPHLQSVKDLYSKSRTLRIMPDKDNQYGTGWIVEDLSPSFRLADGGELRKLYCRLSSVVARYGNNSGNPLAHDKTNIFCSSKWTDVSISEAIGLFIVNQLN